MVFPYVKSQYGQHYIKIAKANRNRYNADANANVKKNISFHVKCSCIVTGLMRRVSENNLLKKIEKGYIFKSP